MTLTAVYCLNLIQYLKKMPLYTPAVVYAYDNFRELFYIFCDRI